MAKVNSLNTSWIKGLLLSAIISTMILILSVAIFVIDIIYETTPDSNFLTFDSIVFPFQFILAIFSILVSLYLSYNCFTWLVVSIKSGGKRKTFNLSISIIFIILTLVLLYDAVMRSILVMKNIGPYLSGAASSLTNPIFVGWLASPDFFTNANVFIVLIASLLLMISGFSFYFLQKALYKSEDKENAKSSTQKHYLNSFVKSKQKEIARKKKVDLSKKITVF